MTKKEKEKKNKARKGAHRHSQRANAKERVWRNHALMPDRHTRWGRTQGNSEATMKWENKNGQYRARAKKTTNKQQQRAVVVGTTDA